MRHTHLVAASFWLALAIAPAWGQGVQQQVPIPLPQAMGGTGGTQGSQKVLCSIRSANFNSTADQSCPLPANIAAWSPTAIWATNCSANLTTAVGGIYPTTSKGGTALVAATQVYTALTGATIVLPLTLATGIATTRYTVSTVYLSLTIAQGGAATCDFYVVGVDLS